VKGPPATAPQPRLPTCRARGLCGQEQAVADAQDANSKAAGRLAHLLADGLVIHAGDRADQLPIGGPQTTPDLFELDARLDGRRLIDDRPLVPTLFAEPRRIRGFSFAARKSSNENLAG
jgi:hypothetical protein